MRSKRYVLVIAGLLMALMLATLLLAEQFEAAAQPQRSFWRSTALPAYESGRRVLGSLASVGAMRPVYAVSEIQATRRISIPFGFDTPLPVVGLGRDVIASGHGGCTADEQVTVAITVTQSASGAVATGQTVETCTGELQSWSTAVAADTSVSFVSGAANACGLATTLAAGYVTDTFDWCREVDLLLLGNRVYLPVAFRD